MLPPWVERRRTRYHRRASSDEGRVTAVSGASDEIPCREPSDEVWDTTAVSVVTKGEISDEAFSSRSRTHCLCVREFTQWGLTQAMLICLPRIKEVRRGCCCNVAPPPSVNLKRSANVATSTLHIRLQLTLKNMQQKRAIQFYSPQKEAIIIKTSTPIVESCSNVCIYVYMTVCM